MSPTTGAQALTMSSFYDMVVVPLRASTALQSAVLAFMLFSLQKQRVQACRSFHLTVSAFDWSCCLVQAHCDREECLRVVHKTTARLACKNGVTAVEHSQANKRAEQRERALRERLHIIVEEVTQTGAEHVFEHVVARWPVRQERWIHDFPKNDVNLCVGGTINMTLHEQ